MKNFELQSIFYRTDPDIIAKKLNNELNNIDNRKSSPENPKFPIKAMEFFRKLIKHVEADLSFLEVKEKEVYEMIKKVRK